MDILYRDAQPVDVPRMTDIILEHVDSPRGEIESVYHHVISTGHFRVAESEGGLIAIAGATVRERLWYLNAYWTRKAHTGRGVGMRLLREVHSAGRADGAETFFTWSSSNPAAIASYLKIGMMPGWTIYVFSGTPVLREPGHAYRIESLDPATATSVERAVFGTYRAQEHVFHSRVAQLRACKVLHKDDVVGYFYAGHGHVGPVAWTTPAAARPVLDLACLSAGAPAAPVTLCIPGINRQALDFAIGSGLRLTYHNHFMTSAAFGSLQHYLPSGPSLF